MKIGILGAGVTGTSVGRSLSQHFEVEILEQKSVCGGIARTKDVDGITYHMIGGHCFNSKYQEVLNFVFNEILPLNEWRKIQRKSKINFFAHEVSYPIEFSIKEIYKFDPKLAFKITVDLLSIEDDGNYNNLEEWFRKKFGNTLAENYFIPYNKKIWKKNPNKMAYEWVADKLPIPNKYTFFEGLMSDSIDSMPHASFYYPKSNNQNTFLDALASGLKIRYNNPVDSICYDDDDKQWVINGTLRYDILINTTPIDRLPLLIKSTPTEIIDAASNLKFNRISNVLWKTQPTDKTWTYLPNKDILFHRHIHIGNFFEPQLPYSISESIGLNSFEELKENGEKDSFLIEALDYNQSEHAYVVFDENYLKSTYIVKEYLKNIGIHSIGRFGEWQYYNMDICIKQSLDLAKKIISQNH